MGFVYIDVNHNQTILLNNSMVSISWKNTITNMYYVLVTVSTDALPYLLAFNFCSVYCVFFFYFSYFRLSFSHGFAHPLL